MVAGFEAGQERWRTRLGTLRQVVRQELVTRQLGVHLPELSGRRVLDVGCGQGTQMLALARRGYSVTGLDTSPSLLAELERSLGTEPNDVRERVDVVQADLADADDLFDAASFDLVLCHGVLMYFRDPRPVLRQLAHLAGATGMLSLLVRNADALALRAGLSGDWEATRKAFEDPAYRNRIGVNARADRRSHLVALLKREGLSVTAWYGVRVFTDIVSDDEPAPAAQTPPPPTPA